MDGGRVSICRLLRAALVAALIPVEQGIGTERDDGQNQDAQPDGDERRARGLAAVRVDARGLARGRHVVRLALGAGRALVSLKGLGLIELDRLGKRFNEAAVEDAAGQVLVVVGLYGFEVAARDAGLIGDVAQREVLGHAGAAQ